jgi:phosphoribosylaminoimidazole (AIR) synthetase
LIIVAIPRGRTFTTAPGYIAAEAAKEEISRQWGRVKEATFVAAARHDLGITQGVGFTKVPVFELDTGYYHLATGMFSMRDIANTDELRKGLMRVINRLAGEERARGGTPLLASNLCDWDSSYAIKQGAHRVLMDAVTAACVSNGMVLTGGETANLIEQVRQTGMGLMFTILSRYDGPKKRGGPLSDEMDQELKTTFGHIADMDGRFEIVTINGMPLLYVREPSKFILTADGAGTKSIACELVGQRTDVRDVIAMTGDDATRDGAIPLLASIGVHASGLGARRMLIPSMVEHGIEYNIPMLGCTYVPSSAISRSTVNGVMLSAVDPSLGIGKPIEPGLKLVMLYDEQRTNGITLQRHILEQAFGEEWYKISFADALGSINFNKAIYDGAFTGTVEMTLGQMVATPATPYFRLFSTMSEELRRSVIFNYTNSSGGLPENTKRYLSPHGLGASFAETFPAPELIRFLQLVATKHTGMSMIPDEEAYLIWSCGNGSVIGTTNPAGVVRHAQKNGIAAQVAGEVVDATQVSVTLRGLDGATRSSRISYVYDYMSELRD